MPGQSSIGWRGSCPGHIKRKSETVFAEVMYSGDSSVDTVFLMQDGENNGESSFIF